jgi:hypothetical protein
MTPSHGTGDPPDPVASIFFFGSSAPPPLIRLPTTEPLRLGDGDILMHVIFRRSSVYTHVTTGTPDAPAARS